MIYQKLLYIILFIFGIFVLYKASSGKTKINREINLIAGNISQEKENKEEDKKKNRQQLEMELLLISANPLLRYLGIVDRNINAKLLTMLFFSGVYYFFNRDAELNDLAIPMIIILLLVILIPGILTSTILASKKKRIMEDMPGFIDLVAVNAQAGTSIEAALKNVATDFKKLNPDLTHVMTRVMRKAELIGMVAALQDFAIALPTTEVRMLCTVLQQSINFGSSVYLQLIQLSSDIRELQLLKIEEKLGTLSAKMSIPLILFIMFPIIILILAPGVMRVFPNVF